ncbi:MAG: C25 family cysteine peptidase, partial [Anaerolineae bacterium]|nr:C25 family cysteine peptidase [Anaerolineae bacterium]
MTSGRSGAPFARRVCCAILGTVLMLTACGSSSMDGASTATAPSSDGAGWTLLVRADGPRWLGPAWWSTQGLNTETLDRTTVTLSQGDMPVSALWMEAPDGWGMLFYGEVVDTDAGPAGGYALMIGELTQVVALQETGLDALLPCQTTTQAQTSYGPDEVFRSTAPIDPPWLWQSLRPVDGVTVTVPFTNAVPGEPLQLTVHAWGQSSMPQDPDHHLRILWNGEPVGDHFWDGSAPETWMTELPGSGLEMASIGIVAPGGTEALVELTWLDEISVSWQQSLIVSPDAWQQWQAESQPGACFSIPDATDAGSYVAAIKRSAGDVRYVRPGVDLAAGQVVVAQEPGDVGWAGVPWTAPAPDVIRERQTLDPAVLRDLDYLVISPSALQAGVAPLVSARREAGLGAGVVAPEEVYDTYGTGVPEAVAIQHLVNDLYTEGRLRYLLLVGDASADPVAVWDPAASVLPTMWVRTSYVGATASDYALAT